jgi:hypothetical protein
MTFRWLGALLTSLVLLILGLALAPAQPVLPPQGTPNGIACAFNSTLPVLTNLQIGWVQCDSSGSLLISGSFEPGTNPANKSNWVSGSGNTGGSGATTIISAATGLKLYINGVQCGRTDAGTSAIFVTLNDSASTILVLANSGSGGGNNQVYTTPLVVAASTALTFTPSSGVSTVYCNAQGYKGS